MLNSEFTLSRGAARPLRSMIAALTAWIALATGASGQTSSAPFTPTRYLMASNESWLWVGGSAPKQSLLLARPASGATGIDAFNIEDGHQVFGEVARLVVLGKSALFIFDNGGMYRFTLRVNDPMSEANVPGDAAPIDVGCLDEDIFAIVPAKAAERFFASPGTGPYSIVEFQGTRWTGVGPIDEIKGRLPVDRPPRIGVTATELFVLWSDDGESIQISRRGRAGGSASAAGRIAAPGLKGFWFTLLSGVPALVTVQDEGASPKLVVRRLLSDIGAKADEWRIADMQVSPLPEGRRLRGYAGASGFNQHLALHAVDDDGRHYVQFARLKDKPLETTISISEVLSAPLRTVYVQNFMHMGLYAVLIFVMVFLFWFRRDSVLQSVALPAGAALAFAFQRLLGWLIDFAPIAVITAVILRVDPAEGLGRLFDWGIVARDADMPAREILVWWGVSSGVYVLYALVAELFAGRTLGKLILGTRVLGESGAAPRVWQLVTRNLMRILELFPQFWIVAFFVLMSRNRQRLGDIFARTVVVRRVDPRTQPDEARDDET